MRPPVSAARAAVSPARERLREALIPAGILLATLVAYAPALRGGFVWDDDAHVTRPDLRPFHGLVRIWTEFGATQQYYPALHTAFWLEHRLWGDLPLGYHLVNVCLHALAAWLVILLLRRLEVPGAWLAGMIFALHPIEVESVAWISEQKNTLSAVFYLSAALVFLRWRGSGPRPAGTLRDYALATALFVLALLSKSVTATLPAALAVVGWWRRKRLDWKSDGVPLASWLVLSICSGCLTAWIERVFIGAQGAPFALGLGQRFLLAGRVVWFYVGKLFWPHPLIFLYPHWRVDAGDPRWWLPLLAAVAATAALAWAGLRRPSAWARAGLCAWAYFGLTLFPALGFVNVYPFLFSYVADHFQYLAGLGAIVLFAAAWVRWLPAPRIAGALLLGVLGVLTWRQCGIYRDAETLYRATLARNPDCWLAHLNLGNILLAQGKVDAAVGHYRRAEALEPGYPSTHFNLGRVMLQEGRLAEAIDEFGRTLQLSPADAEAHNNLGVALADAGRLDEARREFERAIRLRANYGVARANLQRLEAAEAPAPHP